MTLRRNLIRLAHERPDLRQDLVPLLKQGSEDSLHGLVKGFMMRVADELKKIWSADAAFLLRRKGTSLSEAPWVIGLTVSDEAKANHVADRTVAIHLDRESPMFAIYHQPDSRSKVKQITSGGFGMEMTTPDQAARAIAGQWDSASYEPY